MAKKVTKKQNKRIEKSAYLSPIIQEDFSEWREELQPGVGLKSFSDPIRNCTFVLTIFNGLVLLANLFISLKLHSVAEKFLN